MSPARTAIHYGWKRSHYAETSQRQRCTLIGYSAGTWAAASISNSVPSKNSRELWRTREPGRGADLLQHGGRLFANPVNTTFVGREQCRL